VRDILYVSDAVDAYVAAWQRIENVKGRAFNLGGGRSNAVSLRTLLSYIEELLGREIDLTFDDWRPGDQRYYVSNAGAVQRALGIGKPKVDWHSGVRQLALWLRQEGLAAQRRSTVAIAAAS
jgi:CDP-paratose 2-epimerase